MAYFRQKNVMFFLWWLSCKRMINMILGNVQEVVTYVEINDKTYEEIVKG
jgi:hypothetical protein